MRLYFKTKNLEPQDNLNNFEEVAAYFIFLSDLKYNFDVVRDFYGSWHIRISVKMPWP